MKKRGRRFYIHDLPGKLKHLVSTMPYGTWRELEDKTGISHSTFDQACDEDDKTAYSMLGREHQVRLAAACGFSIDWPQWRDPGRTDRNPDNRIDTTQAFIDRLTASVSIRTNQSGTASDPALQSSNRSRGAAPAGNRIAAGKTPPPEPLTGHIALGAIEIHTTQWGVGSVLVSFSVSCLPWRGLAVRRGTIKLDPGGGRLQEQRGTAWMNSVQVSAAQGNGRVSDVTLTRGSGTARVPLWDVESAGSAIGHFRTEGDFAPLVELSPGDRVTLLLGTWLGDVTPSEATTGVEIGEADAATDDLVLVDGALPQAALQDPKGYKRRLIGFIRLSALTKVGDCGFVELSRSAVDIVTG